MKGRSIIHGGWNYESCQNYFFLIARNKVLRMHFIGYKVKFHYSFWSFIQGKRIIRCIFCFLFIGREPTTCLQMGVFLQITFCSLVTAGNTLLRENSRSVPQAARELFHIFTWSKKQWSNDKTIIQLCYRKMWFVSVSEINYLPQPSAWANNWSARHWQITIFCANLLNHR